MVKVPWDIIGGTCAKSLAETSRSLAWTRRVGSEWIDQASQRYFWW